MAQLFRRQLRRLYVGGRAPFFVRAAHGNTDRSQEALDPYGEARGFARRAVALLLVGRDVCRNGAIFCAEPRAELHA